MRSRLSESDRDVAALQGCWEQIELEVDGVPNPSDAHSPAGARTTFVGDRFEVRTADGILLLAGTFVLDATTRPKSITWTDSFGEDMGKQLPAIHELDGDTFVFVAAEEGSPRPSIFKTAPGQTMRRFARRH